jgi:hypothetical protein
VLLDGRLTAGSTATCAAVDCPLGRIPLTDPTSVIESSDGRCVIMLRPEQLRLSPGGTPARVVGGSFFGHDAVIRARLGATGTGPLVLARLMCHAVPEADAVIHLSVEGAATAYPAAA